MATLHGKKLTESQYSALKKKWASEDKKFFKKKYQEDITRLKTQLKGWVKRAADTKRKRGASFGIELKAIASRQAEIKALELKIKQL